MSWQDEPIENQHDLDTIFDWCGRCGGPVREDDDDIEWIDEVCWHGPCVADEFNRRARELARETGA